MAILDGHVNSKTAAKSLNRDVSTMETVLIVETFVTVPIISMGRFAKIKMHVSTRLVKMIKLVLFPRIPQKDIAAKTRIAPLKILLFILFY